jgi:hypothetical protein
VYFVIGIDNTVLSAKSRRPLLETIPRSKRNIALLSNIFTYSLVYNLLQARFDWVCAWTVLESANKRPHPLALYLYLGIKYTKTQAYSCIEQSKYSLFCFSFRWCNSAIFARHVLIYYRKKTKEDQRIPIKHDNRLISQPSSCF